MLIAISNWHRQLLVPDARHPDRASGCSIKLIRKFQRGRMGWDLFILKMPIFGQLGRKEHRRPHHAHPRHAGGQRRADPRSPATSPARPRGNAVFERLYSKVYEAIREGESIAKPMKENSQPGFHPVAAVLLVLLHRRADRRC